MDAYAGCAGATTREALVAALQTALQDGCTWYFGRFLALPGVQQLRGSELDGIWQALQLLAFGTWADYQAGLAAGSIKELPPPTAFKLKVLSLLTLSLQRGAPLTASLDEVCKAVGEGDSIAAERVIHAAVDAGLVEAVIDHRSGAVRLSNTQGRDVMPTAEGLAPLLAQLEAWEAQLAHVQASLPSLRSGVPLEASASLASASSSVGAPAMPTLEVLGEVTKAVTATLKPKETERSGWRRDRERTAAPRPSSMMDSDEEATLIAQLSASSAGPTAGSRRARGLESLHGADGSVWGRIGSEMSGVGLEAGAGGEDELPMKRRTGEDRRPLPRPLSDTEDAGAAAPTGPAIAAPPAAALASPSSQQGRRE